jgi:murein DD-endopeptidase MepM/ murein hydrolase activator NlpD
MFCELSSVLQRSTSTMLGCGAAALLATAAAWAEPQQASGCDFDGDTFDDIAIGIPGESIDDVADMGAVQVIYGTRAGLAAARSQLWHQDVTDILGDGELNDRFGDALACGDFDNDGRDDLAVGVPSEDVPVDSGAVQVIYGTRAGLRAIRNQVWTADSLRVPGVAESRDRFGSALAAGDFNGDGFDDLAIGAPGERIGDDLPLAGSVTVLYGAAAGLDAPGSQLWSQDSGGIAGGAESRDLFGAAVAAGDINGDGRADLAIGVPGEDLGDLRDAGGVKVIYGRAAGVAAAGDQLFTQDTAGIVGEAESFDMMGFATVMGDFDNDGRDDLAIGAPGEDLGDIDSAGAIQVIYGTAGGLTTVGDQLFTQDTTGVLGGAEARDRFGTSLAAGDFNGDGRDDVAAAAPWDSVAGIIEIGTANVLYGTANGIGVAGDQFWHQDQGGVLGVAERRDWLGETLAAGDFNGDSRADLSLAAPGESIGDTSDAGSLNVLYGGPVGLTADADQLWHQGIAGIVGDLETRDRFGGRLRSDGAYRIAYANGTDVRVNGDRLTHSPQQDRIDMSGEDGTTIIAARAGTIEFIVDTNSEPTNNNNYVWISHVDGEWTKYTHFETDSVTDAGRFVGETVSAGTVLGIEGDVGIASGDHLHFEVGVPYDPDDPINGGGFLRGENRDPLICGIPGNTFVAGQTYTARAC